MLDINLFRDSPDTIRNSLINRNGDSSIVDTILTIDSDRRKAIQEAEKLRSEQKSFNSEIAKANKEGKDTSAILEQLKNLSKTVKDLQDKATLFDEKMTSLLLTIPNILHSSVPVGRDSEDNKIIHTWGEPTILSFKPADHIAIGERLGIIDFERATKITGTRFVVMRNKGAQLERALINFFLDHNTNLGFEECIPPFIVNKKSLIGTCQLPKFQADLFHLTDTDYSLISTSEIPITNLYSEEILNESDLPMYFTSYSPCFRSEAGAAGKDTRGMIRVHQFNKVEVVKYSHPDKSYEELETLRKVAESLLEKLELPYRTAALCSGDIGFGAAKCYDLEVWLPGQSAYREISSCSNFEDFQARRANIRFKSANDKKTRFVHTLNGSALAVGRTVVAILENYQQEDGSIKVPKVLQKYTGFDLIK